MFLFIVLKSSFEKSLNDWIVSEMQQRNFLFSLNFFFSDSMLFCHLMFFKEKLLSNVHQFYGTGSDKRFILVFVQNRETYLGLHWPPTENKLWKCKNTRWLLLSLKIFRLTSAEVQRRRNVAFICPWWYNCGDE